MKKDIRDFLDNIKLVELTKGYRIDDFECENTDYQTFLHHHALEYQDVEVSKTHLLINKTNADIIAYMVLVSDSIKLSYSEKQKHDIGFVPFESIPAVKIGQLAVDSKYRQEYKGTGSLMIELARGIAEDIREKGVACRFFTVDADIKNNPTIVDFYSKNGFTFNEKYIKKKKTDTVSMRLDIFKD